MTGEDREYLFDHAQQLSEILNQECVELLDMLEKIETFRFGEYRITNFEMEGSPLAGFACNSAEHVHS